MNTMYRFFFCLFFFFVVFHNVSLSQMCDEKGIKTDPRNNASYNPEKPSAENYFNWMAGPQYKMQSNASYPATYIESPYHTQSPLKPFYDAAKGPNSDYYPEDGWELLKVNVGRLNDDVTFRQISALPIAYVILYNRYTGVMRLFGTLNTKDEHDDIVVKIAYEDSTTGNLLKVSGLLSLSDGISNPLDTRVTESEIEYNHITRYSCNTTTQYFFWSEFNLAYDPCVCNHKSNLRVTFSTIDSSEIALNGTMLSQPKPVTSNNPDPGTVEMIKIVMGIGSIATAIGTQGAIVNVPGILGLFDVFIGESNLSQDDKNNLLLLKSFLELGGDLYNVSNMSQPTTILYTNLYGGIDTLKFSAADKKKGIDAFAKIDKFFASATKIGTSSGGTTSSGSASISAVKLNGYLSDTQDYEDALIRFSTPGSLDSENNPEENPNNNTDTYGTVRPEYVAYNEVLGTMAFLKTPSVNYKSGQMTIIGPGGIFPTGVQALFHEYQLQENLIYAFNPIMHLNLNNTKVYAAFVVEYEPPVPLGAGFVQVVDAVSLKSSLKPILANETKYISEFVPIECFKNMTFGVLADASFNPKLFIRLMIEAESYDIGKSGLPNHVLLVHTIPVKDGVSIGTSGGSLSSYVPSSISMPNSPLTIDIGSNKTSNANTISYAQESITIHATVSTSNSAVDRLIAGEEINIIPNSLILPSVSLEVGTYPYPCDMPMSPVAHSYVKSFCSGQIAGLTYQAYHPPTISGGRYASSEEVVSQSHLARVNLYPNPATDMITLKFVQAKEGTVSYNVYNLNGLRVLNFDSNDSYPSGESNLEISIELLPQGVYLCQFRDSEGNSYTRKFIKE